MTRRRRRPQNAAPALLAAALAAAFTAQADNPNPFGVIVERNPFALRPPPPPEPAEPPKPPEPPANIELTGISMFEGVKKVYLNVKSKDGKTSEPKTFKEGEKQDGIEVLSIDPAAGAVRVRNAGKDGLLTFKDNGAQVPVGAVPKPVVPIAPGMRPPVPVPGGLGSPDGTQAIPSRSLRVPPIPPAQQQPQGGGAFLGVPSQAVQQTASLNAQPGVEQSEAPPAERPLTVEEQVLLIEANKILDEQERQKTGRPIPPLPPTPFGQ